MRFSTFLLCSFLTLSVMGQETVLGSLNHDNEARNYRLYVPADYDGSQSWPLVFNFHGYTSNASEQEVYSGMNAVADTAHFLVCYPNGIGRAWNVGWTFGSTADDVGFVDALIDELSSQYALDASRIYACGMSNGGFMSYRLACERSERFAAIASVTGSIARNYDCSPTESVPVLEIHGTSDVVVPYNGNNTFTIAIDSTIALWVNHNGCNGDPRYEEIENTNLADLSTVERFTYDECQDNTEVMLLRVNGGGHTWPGSPIPGLGTNYDINASVEIWHFFSRFQRAGATATQTPVKQLQLQAYPNPGRELLSLTGLTTPCQLRIYNSVGQLVDTRVLTQPQLNVGELPAGTYFLQVQQEAQSAWVKWIKNRN